MIFEFNDAQILFGMFQGFKKVTPLGGAKKFRLTLSPVRRGGWRDGCSMGFGYGGKSKFERQLLSRCNMFVGIILSTKNELYYIRSVRFVAFSYNDSPDSWQ